MRFSVSLTSLLLGTIPASAQAAQASPALAYEVPASACPSQFDKVTAPARLALTADRHAGQLVAETGRLTLDGPAPATGANDKAAVAADSACQTATPPPAPTVSLAAMTARIPRMPTFGLRKPLIAGRVTSGFGLRVHPLLGGLRMHSGIDLAAPMGSPIIATDGGTVSTAGWQGGYGLAVTIDHANGLRTRYGHMSRISVAPGQSVRQGQVIGLVGSTGRSTGPHLHYEVLFRGQTINPATLLMAPAPKAAKAGPASAR